MSTRQRRSWALVVVLVPLAAVSLWWFFWVDTINRANYDRIRNDMTLTQIEHILGHADWAEVLPIEGGNFLRYGWKGRTGNVSIAVTFENQRITGKQFFDLDGWDVDFGGGLLTAKEKDDILRSCARVPTPLERFRKFLGW